MISYVFNKFFWSCILENKRESYGDAAIGLGFFFLSVSMLRVMKAS
jgi:hypothetical protein